MTKELVSLRILVPDDTTNYVLNPSFRYLTTGWSAFQSTITRTLDFARHGIASLKVVTNGTSLREGTFYRVNSLVNVNSPITVSAYVRGTGKVRIRLIDNNSGGLQWASRSVFLSPNRWMRLEVSGRCTGSNDMRLYVETDNATAKVSTFYVDSAQMEPKPYSTTYCDGDQPDCRWNIMQAQSISTRNAYTRKGGKWVALSGSNRDEEDLYMTVIGGLGMPSIANNKQSYATAPGSYYQSSKILDRIITLTFHAKHVDILGREKNMSLIFLMKLRQYLIDVIKPDLTAGDQEFLVEYKDGDIPLYFRARYDGGLEGEWDIRNRWINSFPLRLLVVSPMLQQDSQEVAYLDFQESFAVSFAASRVNGVWGNMGIAASNAIADLAFGKKGEVFAGGSFTLVNNATLSANRITYWDGSQWQSMSTGANGVIQGITVAPNGFVYVTGSFTTIGGVAAANIAYWDGSAWNAMGTGLGSSGNCIAVAPNGNIYVGGNFTTAGGVNARRIAKWDGTKWSGVGQFSGFSAGIVYAIVVSPDGSYLYVGGSFTDQFGFATNSMLRAAYYDVSTDRFTQVGSGFNNTVLALTLSPSLILYASGDFTASGTTTCNRIAQLSGQTWIPLSSGMDNSVYGIGAAINGDLIAVGPFLTAGGIPCRWIALWNGSSWVNLDVVLYPTSSAGNFVQDVVISPSGDIYIGGNFNTIPNSFFAGITYVTNIGSAEVPPVIYISGPGYLRWLENQTTKKRIFLNLNILSGEEITIDFGAGTIFSTIRGSLFAFVLPGSDFNAFTLVPGENKICTFMTNDVGAIVQLSYTPTHWSVDVSQ